MAILRRWRVFRFFYHITCYLHNISIFYYSIHHMKNILSFEIFQKLIILADSYLVGFFAIYTKLIQWVNLFLSCSVTEKCSNELHCRNRHRSSRPEVSCKKDVFNYFAKFTEKHLCQSLLFNKIAGLRPATLLKRD